MNSLTLLIAFSIIVSVETIGRNPFGKTYVSNMEKSIMNICNKMALNKTSNYDVYNCIIDKNNKSCSSLNNYNQFITIKNECIKDIHSQCGASIFIILISWTLIGIIVNN